MKKYIVILMIAVFSVSLSGCEDLAMLKEKPKKETTEGFMDTPEQVEAVMYSCYYQLKRLACFSRYYHTTIETMADYCYGNGSYAVAGKYDKLDATVIGRLNDVWNCMYRSIRFSNTIILDAPKAKNVPETRLKELLAEARFLRAFAYLHLAQGWGGVPLLTDENQRKPGEHNIPRTPQEDIFKFCARDLEYAAEFLPVKQPLYGRPQQTTAKTVLTEVYLHLGEWEKARDTALEVINSGTYKLVEVAGSDDFYNIFHPSLANTTEEIFYFKHKEGSELGSSFAAMMHGSAAYFDGSFTKGIRSSYSNKFMAAWSDADLRKAFNIYVADNEIYNKKFLGIGCSGQYSPNDYIHYRYADLLLYYAEAECRFNGGPTADAMEKLNMVHRRGYGKPSGVANADVDFKLGDYNTRDKFLDLVFKERGYETCYEGKRYNDMKRMGKLAETILEIKGIEVGVAAYLFPIPNEEFLYNLGLDINKDQNPGY